MVVPPCVLDCSSLMVIASCWSSDCVAGSSGMAATAWVSDSVCVVGDAGSAGGDVGTEVGLCGDDNDGERHLLGVRYHQPEKTTTAQAHSQSQKTNAQ